jgi:hypothetical protein
MTAYRDESLPVFLPGGIKQSFPSDMSTVATPTSPYFFSLGMDCEHFRNRFRNDYSATTIPVDQTKMASEGAGIFFARTTIKAPKPC